MGEGLKRAFAAAKASRSKYRNIPTVVGGVRFASKAEAKRDGELQILKHAGHVRNIERQPRFPLIVGGVKICTYVGDWQYEELSPPGQRTAIYATPVKVVEDRKGALTPAFKIKWALAKALHPEIEWRLS